MIARTPNGNGRQGRSVQSVRIAFATAMAVVTALGGSTQAADRFWRGIGGGEWYDQQRWSVSLLAIPPASVPGLGDIARFEIGGRSYTVTFADAVDLESLKVASDFVTFDLATRQFVTSEVIHLGTLLNDIGSLTLRNGTVTSPVVFVGFTNGDGRLIVENDATLKIEGSQSSLDGTFSIGGVPDIFGGVGQLNVFGTVHALDSDSYIGGSLHGTGTATVDGGVFSTDGTLIIGDDGAEGFLIIQNGGLVTAGAHTFVGKSGRTNEFVDVSGNGEVSITNGTLATTLTATIGGAENSFGEVDLVGENSVWNIGGFLFVSEQGIGNMHVRSGATVTVQNDSFISVGDNEGLLNITGFGSLVNNGNMYVGGSSSSAGGPGHLLVQSNGQLEVGGLLKVWETGTLTLNDGTITTDSLMIQPGATVNFESGSLVINGGPFNVPVNFDFGGSNFLDPPEIILLDGTIVSLTSFSLGINPGTFSAFELDGATLNTTKDINIGGDDAQSLGGGRLSVTSGEANAGDILRVWSDGELVVDSGRVTAAEARISGGTMTVGGVDPEVHIDASGDLPQGLPGIHIGFAPTRSEMTIDDGATLSAPDVDLSVAADLSSLAFLTATGSDSTVIARNARIGTLGDGTLNVMDAANARFTGDLNIGYAPNSFGGVTIEGVGSKVTCEGKTTVGRQGFGSLHLIGGSFHSKGNTRLGALAAAINPAPGFVIVDGGEWVSDGSIFIGGDELGVQGGGGEIFLKTGGIIENQGTMQVWSTGRLSLEGGSLHTRDLLFEPGGSLQLFAGSISVDGGQFKTPSTSLQFGGTDPANPVKFEFLGGTDAQTTFSWHIGRRVDTFGVTRVSGVADGLRSTLRGTSGGGGADLVVGNLGDGRLDVTDGGLVNFGDDVIIGSRDNAVGLVNVNGVLDGVRATIAATRSGSGAAISVGGQHDGGDLSGGSGTLNIRDGGLVQTSGDVYIGRRPQGVGVIRVGGKEVGISAELLVGDDMFIGGDASDGFGDGLLEIQDGGSVEVADTVRIWAEGSFNLTGGTLVTTNLFRESPGNYDLKRGTIRIDGGFLDVGFDTHGYGGPDEERPPTYEFVNGAVFEIPEWFRIGAGAGSFAKTIVDGGNGETPSTIRTLDGTSGADIVVGYQGRGILEVRNGGLAHALADFLVGARTGSNGLAIVDGVNNGVRSTVLADGRGINSSIDVGGSFTTGSGDLRITNGALASSTGDIIMAHSVGSIASVTVDGAASGFNATLHADGNLFLGGTESESGGQATILIGRDALVDVGDTFRVWFDGSVNVEGGILKANHLDLTSAEPGSFSFSHGRVEANRITGDLENFAGTLAHGANIGDMTLDGDYAQSAAATVEIEMIALSVAAVSDTLHVSGVASLAGTLRVILDNGFIPAVGEKFTVMTYGSRIGEFDSIIVEGTVVFDVEYTDQGVELVVADSPIVLGDFDASGVVDLGDYKLFHPCLSGPDSSNGPGAGCFGADLNNNGTVDMHDFSLLQRLFGFAGRADVKRWTSIADGAWDGAANWRGAQLPVAGDHVFIDVPDADITVVHDRDVTFDGPLGNLLCNEKLRLEIDTLSVAGAFQMNNTLEMACGHIIDSTIDLGPSAVITVVPGACASKLDGVTVNGSISLPNNGHRLTILNGLSINGAIQVGGVTGSFPTGLTFQGPDKFINGNAVISFVSNPSSSSLSQADSGNLHIESGITIRGAAGIVGRADAPLVQDGLINSDTSGTIRVEGLDWLNNGTARVSGDGSELWLRGSWTNHGAIEATNAGRLILDGTFNNLGTLTATNSDVRLSGEFAVEDLGTFDFDDSLVVIEGTLLNESGLILDGRQFNWKLGGGTILGGTVSSLDGTTLDLVRRTGSSIATLDGATLDADLRMSGGIVTLYVRNGLTLNGSIGMSAESNSLSALVHVFGPDRYIDGSGRIEFLTDKGNAIIQGGHGAGDLGVMTIGQDISIVGARGVVGESGSVFDASLVNEGTIHSDRPGIITIQGQDWFNTGMIRSSGGGQIRANGSWANDGTVQVEPGPFLNSPGDYIQSGSGSLVSVVRSTVPDGYGTMIVAGRVILGGTLRLEFEEVFVPAAGQSFVVLQYGSRLGTFDFIEAPGLDSGLQLVPTYQEGFLSLAIQAK